MRILSDFLRPAFLDYNQLIIIICFDIANKYVSQVICRIGCFRPDRKLLQALAVRTVLSSKLLDPGGHAHH